MRAARRIENGEEILFCYSRLGNEFRSRARRTYLQVFGQKKSALDLLDVVRKQATVFNSQELYHFTCDCVACDQSEEEIEQEEREWQRRRELEREEEIREAELFLETCHLDLME